MARESYPFAVNTYAYTLSHPAIGCVRHLAERGYTDFELMMYPGHLWPATADEAARRELRGLVEAGGLRIVSLNMPNIDLNVAAAAEEMRRHTLGILHGVIGLAGDLGVPGVVIGPGKANPLMPAPEEALLGHFFRALDQLAPHAERVGTRLLVENMPFAFLPQADQLMAALERYGDERIRVIYDVANGHFAGEDPVTVCAGSRRGSPWSISRTRQGTSTATAPSARGAWRLRRCRRCSKRSATAICRCSRSSPPIRTGRSATAPGSCSSWAGRVPAAEHERMSRQERTVESEVVVVGGGGAGLAAAIEARACGCEVILIEKNPALGGSTAWSIGSITATGTPHQIRRGIQDSPAEHWADMPRFAGDLAPRDNDALRQVLCDHVPETFRWLLALGVRFYGPMPEPPHQKPRMHNVLPNARAYIYHLERHARRIGVGIHAGIRARQLVREGGRVVGVACETADGAVRFLGRRGVILAAGDFTNGPELKARYMSAEAAKVEGVNLTATGDGQTMALEVGARIVNGDLALGPRSGSFRRPARPWRAGCRPGQHSPRRWPGRSITCRPDCSARS